MGGCSCKPGCCGNKKELQVGIDPNQEEVRPINDHPPPHRPPYGGVSHVNHTEHESQPAHRTVTVSPYQNQSQQTSVPHLPPIQGHVPTTSADTVDESDGDELDGASKVGGNKSKHTALVKELETQREAYNTVLDINQQMGAIQTTNENQLREKEVEINELKMRLNEVLEREEMYKIKHMNQGNMTEDSDQLHAKIASLRDSRSELKNRCESLKQQNRQLEQQLSMKCAECDELMTRLSQIASEQLQDNNPNIADLSDQNRPEKLADRFSELYCNEWTDAYEELTVDCKMSAKRAIHLLLELVERIYNLCHELSNKQLKELRHQILIFTGHAVSRQSLKNRPELSTKRYKEERKKQYKMFLDSLNYDVEQIKTDLLRDKHMPARKLHDYMTLATELCWLMSVQDPPVELYFHGKEGGAFDRDYYTTYTKSGKNIAYIVWPAMLLHKDGPVLRKGTAQGKVESQKFNCVKTGKDDGSEAYLKKGVRPTNRKGESSED